MKIDSYFALINAKYESVGCSQVGKASEFGSDIQRFESFHPRCSIDNLMFSYTLTEKRLDSSGG